MSNFTESKSYTWNFQIFFSCVITIIVKFDIHFLGLSWEIFLGVTTDNILHLKPLKNVKKNAIFFKLFWYKVFVHWKLKLLIPGGFRLNASIYNHRSRIKVESRNNLSILKMLSSKKATEYGLFWNCRSLYVKQALRYRGWQQLDLPRIN